MDPQDLLLILATASTEDLTRLAAAIKPKTTRPMSDVTLAMALKEAATAALLHKNVIQHA